MMALTHWKKVWRFRGQQARITIAGAAASESLVARLPWFAYDLLCIPSQSTNRPYEILCQGALHIFFTHVCTPSSAGFPCACLDQRMKGGGTIGVDRIRGNHPKRATVTATCASSDLAHSLSRLPTSHFFSGGRTVALFQAETDRSRNASGYSRLYKFRRSKSLLQQITSSGVGCLQSDTRMLREGRVSLFSGVFGFKADGPSVLDFLVGGVEAQ